MDKWKRRMYTVAGAAGGFALIALCITTPVVQQEDPERYLGWKRAVTSPEPMIEPMTLDEHVLTLLPTMESDDVVVRETGLEALTMTLSDGGAKELSEGTLDEISQSLIGYYVLEDSEDGKVKPKSDIMRMLVTQIKDDAARDFTLEVLESDDRAMRDETLKLLLERGAIRDKAVREKAYELAKGDTVSAAIRPRIMRRFKGRKAEADILALFDREIGNRAVQECAVEIQNLHKPELMGKVLTRLDKAGLLASSKTMPWLSGKLLSQHIEKAEGTELVLALRAVWLRPSLTRSTMQAMKDRLEDADPMIRRMVARIIPDAIEHDGLDPVVGEEALSARLEVETDPEVKVAIEGSLSQMRNTRRTQPGPVEQAPAVE